MVDIPFLGALAGCSARRSERRVASHTSEEQRRNAPARAAKNGILAFSASLNPQQFLGITQGFFGFGMFACFVERFAVGSQRFDFAHVGG